jgi:hypothetical protein
MKREIKGKASILINREYTTIEIYDKDANVMFAKIELTPEQLSMCLSRQVNIDCKLIVNGLEKVGKKHENDTFTFPLPIHLDGNSRDKNKIAEYAQPLYRAFKQSCDRFISFKSNGS